MWIAQKRWEYVEKEAGHGQFKKDLIAKSHRRHGTVALLGDPANPVRGDADELLVEVPDLVEAADAIVWKNKIDF